MVLPVEPSMKRKEKFPLTLTVVMTVITAIYASSGGGSPPGLWGGGVVQTPPPPPPHGCDPGLLAYVHMFLHMFPLLFVQPLGQASSSVMQSPGTSITCHFFPCH